MKTPLHVFVIMPYGIRPIDDGRQLRFDAIYDELLKPALKKAGCVAFRADQENAAGDIRTDMFYELVTADVVIADTSMQNVNVFYEIGVRHMTTPRGAILVGAIGTKAPFDTGPDRRMLYDASPWVEPNSGPTPNTPVPPKDALVKKLAGSLRDAIAAQTTRIGSPIFSHLTGLKPCDPSSITAGEAVSLGMQVEQLIERIANARESDRPGDILTIAQTAPTSTLRRHLMRKAARALIDMRQYVGALRVLEQHHDDVPDDVEMESLRGMVLNRVGRGDDAKSLLDQLGAKNATNSETAGMLGRVFKDRWRARFEMSSDPAQRLKLATTVEALSDAQRSFDCYAGAARPNLNRFYVGVNAIAMGRLLQHLAIMTNTRARAVNEQDLADLHAATRCALGEEIRRVAAPPGNRGSDAVWCHATRGELALLGGDSAGAEDCYNDAVRADPKPFEVDSMLTQLRLYELLGWRPNETRACIAQLEPLHQPRAKGFARVAVCSGHMIDRLTRSTPRFPQQREQFVRERIAETMDAWKLGPNDLALCGGARGADTCLRNWRSSAAARSNSRSRSLSPSFVASRFIWKTMTSRGRSCLTNSQETAQSCLPATSC